MNWISLAALNRLRFAADPVPEAKLQRWCRDRLLPARKFGGEWRVDLDAFDALEKPVANQATGKIVRLAIDNLRRARENDRHG